ncbi:MAG TPA: hypothetical protein VJ912_02795 [Candidatus Nanoarchaeia archaeon]|nr:hypothetical protein [Candidatus Nanoarchaeia archaeon]
MVNTIDQKFRVKEKTDEQGNTQIHEIQKLRNRFIGFAKWESYRERFNTGPEGKYYQSNFFRYKKQNKAMQNCELLNKGKREKVIPSKTIEIKDNEEERTRIY